MSAGPEERSAAGRPPPSDTAWLAVSDGLLRGINHALSNRLAALGAVAQVLGSGNQGSMLELLRAEIGNLEQTARLLHLLPREPNGTAEPIVLGELLPDVVALHRLQGGLRDLEYRIDGDPHALPVWGERAVLVRALLMLLNGAARAAQLRGEEIGIRYAGDASVVTLVVESAAPSAATAGPPVSVPAEDVLAPMDASATADLLQDLGGEITVEQTGDPLPGLRCTLHLPTLTEVRRREKAG